MGSQRRRYCRLLVGKESPGLAKPENVHRCCGHVLVSPEQRKACQSFNSSNSSKFQIFPDIALKWNQHLHFSRLPSPVDKRMNTLPCIAPVRRCSNLSNHLHDVQVLISLNKALGHLGFQYLPVKPATAGTFCDLKDRIVIVPHPWR